MGNSEFLFGGGWKEGRKGPGIEDGRGLTEGTSRDDETRRTWAAGGAAWFARMQAWVARKPTEGMPLGLPVILVCGHSWELSFVCDRGEKLDFIHGFPIGGTKNLVGMYRLLAVLRVLVEWMDTKFRSFFNKLLDIV